MPSVAHFINNLGLDKADERTLLQHVQECHLQGGPSLDDRCTERVRKYLKQNSCNHLSWDASLKLEEELEAGFSSKQAYKMGIPAIGIVAVLVANVTFVAWVTPPGGSSPSWAGCDYPIFTSFLILDGIAFMLSVASVIVVTAFPLILNRTPHQAAWWGGVLLLLSMIAFIAAFVLAGFVTVNYRAPNASCASLHCADGGVQCSTYAVSVNGIGIFTLNPNVGVLNNMGNTNLSPVCVQYNVSAATSDAITTLYPGNPQCPGTTEYSSASDFRNCTDVQSLLQNARFQRQVVCMPQSSFPSALPTTDSVGLTIPINSSLLAPYTSLTKFYEASDDHRITDLISTPGNQTDLLSYYDLAIVCYSTYSEGSAFDTLCDTTLGLNLSVTKTGEYMTEAIAASNGATIFGVDLFSKQVATSIEVLSAFFGLVLVLIIVYLIRTKLKH